MITDLRTIEKSAFDAQNAGDFQLAISLWLELVFREERWEHGYAYFNLGNCYIELREFDRAEQAFLKAIAVEPNDSLFTDALESLLTLKRRGHI